jgi:beta-glucosidase
MQRLGGCPVVEKSQGISQAADLAARSDISVVFVGLNSDWESEGFDRPTLALPRDQDELIHAVALANPATVVVIQTVCYSFKVNMNKLTTIHS